MIEAILAWLCLFIGAVTQNANYFIASGVFAVAAQIELYRKKGGK
ncbi:MAG: hypothetical protein UHG68_08820 [Clostridia bacterium]|nr:hypothetical protein [Clostridia bacterium]